MPKQLKIVPLRSFRNAVGPNQELIGGFCLNLELSLGCMKVTYLLANYPQATDVVSAKRAMVKTVGEKMTLLRKVDREEMVEAPGRKDIVKID